MSYQCFHFKPHSSATMAKKLKNIYKYFTTNITKFIGNRIYYFIYSNYFRERVISCYVKTSFASHEAFSFWFLIKKTQSKRNNTYGVRKRSSVVALRKYTTQLIDIN